MKKAPGFFDRRVRGFRIVELGGAAVLLVLVLAVYLAKTGAGGKRADIDKVQQQITAEQAQIRLLRAEVASLEQPERLEALSSQYLGLQPVPAKHEVPAESLGELAALVTAVPAKPASAAGADTTTQAAKPAASAAELTTATTPAPAAKPHASPMAARLAANSAPAASTLTPSEAATPAPADTVDGER
jgi:cell division protein FtsL